MHGEGSRKADTKEQWRKEVRAGEMVMKRARQEEPIFSAKNESSFLRSYPDNTLLCSSDSGIQQE